MDNSLWKKLWTCRETDCRVMKDTRPLKDRQIPLIMKATDITEGKSLIELRVICAMARRWKKPTCRSRVPIPICWNQSQEVQRMALKRVITKYRNPHIQVHELWDADENCALLHYYAGSSGNSLQTFWDNLSVPPSRVKNSKSQSRKGQGITDAWRRDVPKRR